MRSFPKNTFDFTSLIARISTGTLMFYLHGLGKITSGYHRWERLGKTVTDIIGVDSMAIPLGFMASVSESILAIFILIGFYTRTSTFFSPFTKASIFLFL